MTPERVLKTSVRGQDSTPPVFDAEDEYRPEPSAPPRPPAWQDGSIRIGIHTSIVGDIVQSLETAQRLGANAVQIFSASPRMWPSASGGQSRTSGGKAAPTAEVVRFRARRSELGLGPLAIHDNYLINLASPDRVLRVRSIQAFHDEVVRAMALGADFLVAHPGASRGNGPSQAIADLTQALRQATRGLKLGRLRILIENTAGQGTMLGSRFEELKQIVAACPELALGVCIDTAHLFEAGYPIHSAEGLERTLEALERTVQLKRVCVVHMNDSKTPFGSRVDRHQHIGKGKIGLEAFRRILNHPLLAGRAFILETPIDKPGDDRRNVHTLWRLVGVEAKTTTGARDGFRARRKRSRGKPKAKASPTQRHADTKRRGKLRTNGKAARRRARRA